MNILIRLLCFIGLFAYSYAMADSSISSAVHEYQLKNGMKLIVKENHRAPTMVSQLWYKVGSGYEPSGMSGISHVLEHMMFKGTPTNPAGTFSRLVAENGGQENAFTANDATTYFQKLPADKYELSFRLEADRMQHLTFNAKEFSKELEVIKEERRMRVDDNPQTLAYEQLMAKANAGQPYQQMTIGLMKDISNTTMQSAREWYHKWYTPNNAILVVAGDVNPRQVYEAANRYFGKINSRTLPAVKPSIDPKAPGLRHATVSQPAQLPYLLMGYNTPSLITSKQIWQPYALEVIAEILDGGNSARLPKHLVRGSQIASEAQSNYDLYSRYSGLFIVGAIPAKGHTMEELRNALLKEINDLKTLSIPAEELERVKTRLVAEKIYQQDSVFGQAMAIGRAESIGLSWRDEDAFVDRIKAITPQQVQEAAKQFLTSDHLTIVELQPQSMSGDHHA